MDDEDGIVGHWIVNENFEKRKLLKDSLDMLAKLLLDYYLEISKYDLESYDNRIHVA